MGDDFDAQFNDPAMLDPIPEDQIGLSKAEVFGLQRDALIRELDRRYEQAVQDELHAIDADKRAKAEHEKIVDLFRVPELTILCPYCSAPYTASMISDLYGTSSGCDSCGYEVSGTIDIYCSNCKKLVYRKEYD